MASKSSVNGEVDEDRGREKRVERRCGREGRGGRERKGGEREKRILSGWLLHKAGLEFW